MFKKLDLERCFFCTINVFCKNSSNLCVNSSFLKKILLNEILCINNDNRFNDIIYIYNKVYLNNYNIKYLYKFFSFLKGKNIYYIFILNDQLFLKLFNILLFCNDIKDKLDIKYGLYIQPINFIINNKIYFSNFNNQFNFILYNKFFFFEKFISVNKININKNYFLFVLNDIFVLYINNFSKLIYLLF